MTARRLSLLLGAIGWLLRDRTTGIAAAFLFAVVGVAPQLEGFTLNAELAAALPATGALAAALLWARGEQKQLSAQLDLYSWVAYSWMKDNRHTYKYTDEPLPVAVSTSALGAMFFAVGRPGATFNNGNARCVSGYFTRFVELSDAWNYSPGAPTLGASILRLIR